MSRSDLRFEVWKTVFVKRDMRVYMIDLYTEICKPVLQLDFTAHGIVESLSEFGLGSFVSNSANFWKRFPNEKLTGGFFGIFFLFIYFIQHCFICRPSYSNLCRRMLRPNPGLLQLWHWESDSLTTRLDLLHPIEKLVCIKNLRFKYPSWLLKLFFKRNGGKADWAKQQ